MHAAAYRALGMPHTYEKLETSEAELPARVEALRRGELAGLNVTVPHKRKVLALVDEVDASARATGAANTLVRTAGRPRARAQHRHACDRRGARAPRRRPRARLARRRRARDRHGRRGAGRDRRARVASRRRARAHPRPLARRDRRTPSRTCGEIDRLLAAAGGRGVSVALGADGLHAPEKSRRTSALSSRSCRPRAAG